MLSNHFKKILNLFLIVSSEKELIQYEYSPNLVLNKNCYFNNL